MFERAIRNSTKVSDQVEEGEENDRELKYEHVCPNCNHVICEHFYSWTYHSDKNADIEMMECRLCGRGLKEHPRFEDFENSKEDEEETKNSTTKGPIEIEGLLETASTHMSAVLASRSVKKDSDSGSDWSDDED
jgi:hypothetical protein